MVHKKKDEKNVHSQWELDRALSESLHGKGPLHVAKLLALGANPDSWHGAGALAYTPTMTAAHVGKPRNLAVLLPAADLFVRGPVSGHTAVMVAAEKGRIECMEMLAEAMGVQVGGADPRARADWKLDRDNWGRGLLALARASGSKSCFDAAARIAGPGALGLLDQAFFEAQGGEADVEILTPILAATPGRELRARRLAWAFPSLACADVDLALREAPNLPAGFEGDKAVHLAIAVLAQQGDSKALSLRALCQARPAALSASIDYHGFLRACRSGGEAAVRTLLPYVDLSDSKLAVDALGEAARMGASAELMSDLAWAVVETGISPVMAGFVLGQTANRAAEAQNAPAARVISQVASTLAEREALNAQTRAAASRRARGL